MYASIFKEAGSKWSLVMHREPGLESEVLRLVFGSKAEAKAEAKKRQLKAWNY